VQSLHADPQNEIDMLLVEILLGVERQRLARLPAAQKLLGEWRTIVRNVGLVTDESDGAVGILTANLFGSLAAGQPAANEEILGGFHEASHAQRPPMIESGYTRNLGPEKKPRPRS